MLCDFLILNMILLLEEPEQLLMWTVKETWRLYAANYISKIFSTLFIFSENNVNVRMSKYCVILMLVFDGILYMA